MTSKIVRQFWNDMNKHGNARYKKVDNYTIAELGNDRNPRASEPRGRLVIWVQTDSGKWAKLGGKWGEYNELLRTYNDLPYRNDDSVSTRRKAQKMVKSE